MAEPAGKGPLPVWVWSPAGDSNNDFQHPSEIPLDLESAKVRWMQNRRGPRLARISRADLLQTKGSMHLIAENGATREVPKFMVLPWYEGLLLLDTLVEATRDNAVLKAEWLDDELLKLLEQERVKYKSLKGPLYMEKKLVNTAITGASFFDKDEREHHYRRENVKGDDMAGLVEGVGTEELYKIKEVIGYLPPWEAFCNEKCGFYQDFYLVRWDHPFSEVDYSKVENGCSTTAGSTWEPDECLPPQLDPLRVASKQAWIRRQRDVENKKAVARRTAPPSPEGAKRPRTEAFKAEPPPPKTKTKLAQFRRDGKALEADMFRLSEGHDFDFGDMEDKNLANVRTGWPKAPQDYPPGYRVANPPGFCWEGCDCMDDQRVQHAWEVTKAWLEDRERTRKAKVCIDNLTQQVTMLRRRGEVRKMHYFEALTEKMPDMTHARAAIDLAGRIARRIADALQAMPLGSLSANSSGPPVTIPAVAFLTEEHDALPLRYEAADPLPGWLRLDEETGALRVSSAPDFIEEVTFTVKLHLTEGCKGKAQCTVIPPLPAGSRAPWSACTGNIMAHFNNLDACLLDRHARSVLSERLADIWDFQQRAPREVSLAKWLHVIATVMRMLRSTAVAHITPGAPREVAPILSSSALLAAPMTPT